MTTPDIDLSGIEHRSCPKRGVLTFWHLPPEIQRREDSTMECDQRTQRRRRPATDTERLLLAHLYGTLPTDLETRVEWVSPGVRRRYWPAIPATLQGLDQL